VHVSVGAGLGAVREGNATADVWCAWLHEHANAVPDLAAALLSGAERARMERYRNAEAAARYVITRSLVREVLSERLGVAPQRVDIRVTDFGKPVVADDLHLNVRHSGDLIILAVSVDCAVGIDVERRREVERVEALTARWLTSAERGEVASLRLTGLGESDAFLRVWSSKEAKLKALGVGISGATSSDLTSVKAVSLDELLSRSGKNAADYVGAVAFA